MLRTCPTCGHDNAPVTKFCVACGADLLETADAVDPSPDPFSTPFEADVGDATSTLLVTGRRRGGFLVAVTLALAAGAAGGFVARELTSPGIGSGVVAPGVGGTPAPSDVGPSPTAESPLVDVGSGTSVGPGDDIADVALGPDDGRPAPIGAEQGTGAGTQPGPDGTGPPGLDEEADQPPDGQHGTPPAAAELVTRLAGTVVAFARDRGAGKVAPLIEPRRAVPPLPIPPRLLELIDGARRLAEGRAALWSGRLDQLDGPIEVARSLLPREATAGLADDVARVRALELSIGDHIQELDCRTGRELTAQLAELSPGLAESLAEALRDCARQRERARGLPPRTLE